MNIERVTKGGNVVTIQYEGGYYVHPMAKSKPIWVESGGRTLGPVKHAVAHNEQQETERRTPFRKVAERWCVELVKMLERSGQ